MVQQLIITTASTITVVILLVVLMGKFQTTKDFHRKMLEYWPYKILFGSFPSVTTPDRKWALFQTILSFAFFFISLGFATLAIDLSKGNKSMSIYTKILFGLGIAIFIYAIGLGTYYYNRNKHNDCDTGKANREIREGWKKIKEAENERNNKLK